MIPKISISHNKHKGNKHIFKSIYEDQLLELAEIRFPAAKDSEYRKIAEGLKKSIKPVYIHFPWRSTILECVGEKDFFELKTNRNQLLITREEQEILRNLKVSVAGMSVGSSILFGLVGSGIGKNINIADYDYFSTSNLNRVSATLLDVAESKADVAFKRSIEMDPFVNVVSFKDGVNSSNINEFMFRGKADIIFEEIDDLKMKVAFREYAKHNKIPLVMLTNISDTVMIDVERYDQEIQPELFNGLVDNKTIEMLKKESGDSPELLNKLVVALVDKNLLSDRVIKTLSEIGNTLVGRPQLYSSVAMDGGIAAYLTRRIFIDNNLDSGRYSLKLSSIN